MEKTINIGGRLHNPAVGGSVAGADEIKDDTKGKMQNVINQETDAELVRLDEAKQEKLTFDQIPTEGSTNPVTSGGVHAADAALQQAIEAILLLIPSAASALNQLADKSFVNSSISTATATFRGTYNLVTDLELTVSATHQQIATTLASVVSTADNNDYCFVQIPVSDQSTDIRVTERYKFNGTSWSYEYDLNNSGFTADQWAAINSGITSVLVSKLGALPTAAELAVMFAGKQNTLTFDSTPVAGSDNPVKSSGLYNAFAVINAMIPVGADANNKLVAESRLVAYVTTLINALDATFDVTSADGHVTLRMTQVDGVITSVQILTSDIASASALTTLAGRVSTAESDIDALQDAYAALTQSDVVIVEGALPSSGQLQNIIYRQPDQDHTPPQFYSDYMWNGTTWVLMATYMNAIDPRPKKGSQNLVTSGGVFDNMGALDVSELNATENPHTLATYADLSAALAAIPSDYQKGGMSIKFVSSVDNNYVQFRYMSSSIAVADFTNVANWQGVDEKPTAGSDNLVKSNGIIDYENTSLGVVILPELELGSLLDNGQNYTSTSVVRTKSYVKTATNVLKIRGFINTMNPILPLTADTFKIKLLGYNSEKQCLGAGTGWKTMDDSFITYTLPTGTVYVRVLLNFKSNNTDINISSVVAEINDARFEACLILNNNTSLFPNVFKPLKFKSGETVEDISIENAPVAHSDNLVKSGGVLLGLNHSLNNSINYSELEKLPLIFVQGTFNDYTGAIEASTTTVTTQIVPLSNIDVLEAKYKDTVSVKSVQFNGTSFYSYTAWGKRLEYTIVGDGIRFAIKRDDNSDISVSDVINEGLFEVYVKRQLSAIKTSREYAKFLNIGNIEGTLVLPEIEQGTLNNDGSLYYANDSIHFKDFVEVIPNTTYYIKINDGYKYKVLRSSDGSTIDGIPTWTTAATYNPGTSKYIKVVVSTTSGGTLFNVFDLYKSGLAISRTPFVIPTKQGITDYISAESLQKTTITPTLENYAYFNGFIPSDIRLSIRNLIEVDTFFEYTITSSITNLVVVHTYFDKDKNYIKQLLYRPTKERVHVDKNVRYVSLSIFKSDNGNISPSDVSVSFTAYTNSGNTEVVKTYAHKKHANVYYGEKINLGHDFDRDIFIEDLPMYGDDNTNVVKQGCLYHNGLFYQFYNLGYCIVYNTETKTLVRQFYLNGSSTIEGLHCNCATLVKEDASGIYVCLASWNSPTAYIYYITNDSCSLVQTINITVENHNGSNIFVDKLNKKLYILYQKTGDTTKLYINKYNTPSLSEATVNIGSDDIIASHEIGYCSMQDVFVNGGKMYLLYGARDEPIGITVYSLDDFSVRSLVDLSAWNTEPEGITQYGNEILMSYYSNQTVFQLTFD